MILTILLWTFLAVCALSVLTTVTEASKPRPLIEPAVGCLAGGVLLVCTVPVVLLLAGAMMPVKTFASWVPRGRIREIVSGEIPFTTLKKDLSGPQL